MLPCNRCGYHQNIPGDCHLACSFDWQKDLKTLNALIGGANVTPRTAQWFLFPYNFDPVWGPNECPKVAVTADPDLVSPSDPIVGLLSLLGKRFIS